MILYRSIMIPSTSQKIPGRHDAVVRYHECHISLLAVRKPPTRLLVTFQVPLISGAYGGNYPYAPW